MGWVFRLFEGNKPFCVFFLNTEKRWVELVEVNSVNFDAVNILNAALLIIIANNIS